MNKRIWRRDRSLMLLVNASGYDLLSRMRAQADFPRLVEDAFAPKTQDARQFALSTVEALGRMLDFEDCFLQAAAFTVALWSRGLIDLAASGQAVEALALAPLLRRISGEADVIRADRVFEALLAQAPDPRDLMGAFHREEGRVVSLLLCGALAPIFAGEAEDFERADVVPDILFPRYTVGYLKPALLEALDDSQEGLTERVGCAFVAMAAGGAAIAAAGYVWNKTVEQESGQGKGPDE